MDAFIVVVVELVVVVVVEVVVVVVDVEIVEDKEVETEVDCDEVVGLSFRSISKIAHCPLELEAMFLPESGRNWFWSREFTETTWMDTAHHTQRSNDG